MMLLRGILQLNGVAEVWLLMLAGQTNFLGAVVGFILAALAGNIVGGTGLFAVVARPGT